MIKIAPIMVEETQSPWKHGQNFNPYSSRRRKLKKKEIEVW